MDTVKDRNGSPLRYPYRVVRVTPEGERVVLRTTTTAAGAERRRRSAERQYPRDTIMVEERHVPIPQPEPRPMVKRKPGRPKKAVQPPAPSFDAEIRVRAKLRRAAALLRDAARALAEVEAAGVPTLRDDSIRAGEIMRETAYLAGRVSTLSGQG